MSDEAPKIIVDDDWKSQAKKEKEKLASESTPATGDGAGKTGPGGLPAELGFDDIVRMLATQALMYMGAFPDPKTGRAVVSLELAKAHVDMLSILETKTAGNLTEEESSRMTEMLRELRAQFVEISRAVAQAQAEGRISPDGSVNPGAGGSGAPGGAV